MILYQTSLPIEGRTKKNSMKIVSYKNGRYGVVQSDSYRAFSADAVRLLVNPPREPIRLPVNIRYTFFMSSRRRVDGLNLAAAMDDVLVQRGILADDNRNIVAAHDGTRVLYDKSNPRIEIVISTLDEPYEIW